MVVDIGGGGQNMNKGILSGGARGQYLNCPHYCQSMVVYILLTIDKNSLGRGRSFFKICQRKIHLAKCTEIRMLYNVYAHYPATIDGLEKYHICHKNKRIP